MPAGTVDTEAEGDGWTDVAEVDCVVLLAEVESLPALVVGLAGKKIWDLVEDVC